MLKKNVGATMFGGRVVAFTAEAIAELSRGGAVAQNASRGVNLRGDNIHGGGQGSTKHFSGDPHRMRKAPKIG